MAYWIKLIRVPKMNCFLIPEYRSQEYFDIIFGGKKIFGWRYKNTLKQCTMTFVHESGKEIIFEHNNLKSFGYVCWNRFRNYLIEEYKLTA